MNGNVLKKGSDWDRAYAAAQDVVASVPAERKFIMLSNDDELYLSALITAYLDEGWRLHGPCRAHGQLMMQSLTRSVADESDTIGYDLTPIYPGPGIDT